MDIKAFIQGVGALTEVWTLMYQSFKQQGMSDEDAIKHTSAMMKSIVEGSMET